MDPPRSRALSRLSRLEKLQVGKALASLALPVDCECRRWLLSLAAITGATLVVPSAYPPVEEFCLLSREEVRLFLGTPNSPPASAGLHPDAVAGLWRRLCGVGDESALGLAAELTKRKDCPLLRLAKDHLIEGVRRLAERTYRGDPTTEPDADRSPLHRLALFRALLGQGALTPEEMLDLLRGTPSATLSALEIELERRVKGDQMAVTLFRSWMGVRPNSSLVLMTVCLEPGTRELLLQRANAYPSEAERLWIIETINRTELAPAVLDRLAAHASGSVGRAAIDARKRAGTTGALKK